MRKLPFIRKKLMPKSPEPIRRDSYPPPLTEQQIEWVPEDGFPAGDEPFELAEGEDLPSRWANATHTPYFPDGGPGLTEEVPS